MMIIENKKWEILHDKYEWVRDMESTPQSKIHHAEGNVAIHTQMVLAELEKDLDYQNLSSEDKEIVWTAALFHDIEKRSTTIELDGDLTSPNHAKKGAQTTRQILYKDFNLEFHVREQIVSLVRYHGLPIWCMEKPDPKKALYECALRTNMYLLYLLAKADMKGRICQDKNAMLEKVEFFKEYCIEISCFYDRPKFHNDLSRFKYFYTDISEPYEVFDDTICEVFLMSGLPGMGKDTYISNNFPKLPIVSLDNIRRKNNIKKNDKSINGWVAQEAKEEARKYLRTNTSFIWNATNITKQMRSQLIDLFFSYNAKVKIIYIEKPFKDWKKQNKNREYEVPDFVLEKLLSKLEIPEFTEGVEVRYITN